MSTQSSMGDGFFQRAPFSGSQLFDDAGKLNALCHLMCNSAVGGGGMAAMHWDQQSGITCM